MITRICQHCQQPYQTFASQKPKYCSSACAGLAKRRGGGMVSCKQCGKQVYSHPSEAREYCSKSCARTAANLGAANPSHTRDLSGEHNPMFGRGRSGSDNPMYGRRKDDAPRWTGGRKRHNAGYILIVAPDEHPYPAYVKKSGLKYILEHRHVMEQHLGRYLDPHEVVHHRDGDRANNALENLELFSSQAEHMSTRHATRESAGSG